ncbi:hypothetical protein, partial [Faecalibacterium sp. DFI.5.82]|uniref:hypothetical protein n=1 Tax=Faecalibacterium sp. DFI.5.82 TaxID=3031725 RepID=UPI0023AF9C3A
MKNTFNRSGAALISLVLLLVLAVSAGAASSQNVGGGKEGLQPVEQTVIDRCVHVVYRKYFENPIPENMP